jgi:hypothetical protein
MKPRCYVNGIYIEARPVSERLCARDSLCPQGLALFFGLLQAMLLTARRSMRKPNTRLEPPQLGPAKKLPSAVFEKIERCLEKKAAAATLRASVAMVQT